MSVGPLEKTLLAELMAIKGEVSPAVACKLMGNYLVTGVKKQGGSHDNGSAGSGQGYSAMAAGICYYPGFCLTSLLMMLEATVNSGLMKFTDDAKLGSVINSRESRAKPWRD